MRRIVSLIIVFCVPLIFCSCGEKASEKPQEKDAVIFKMPEDDTVNGYRTGKPETAKSDKTDSSDTSSSGSSAVASSDSGQLLYYANTNTKKFHLKSCSSAQKILNKNLYITENRQELITDGYEGCAICKP